MTPSIAANAGVVRPIFVLGAPRSGTTMVGNFVGSDPQVCNLVEYSGFYFLDTIARREYSKVPFPAKEIFLKELFEFARSFADRYTASEGKSCYVDSTPWNLLVANSLASKVPDAAFIVCVRRYEGVVQSLKRSFDGGFAWAGADVTDRLKLWLFMNSLLLRLSQPTTHYFYYDHMCESPEAEIHNLECFLEGLGVTDCNRDVFARGHAASGRPTVAARTGDAFRWTSMASFDQGDWDLTLRDLAPDVHELVSRAKKLQAKLDLLGGV